MIVAVQWASTNPSNWTDIDVTTEGAGLRRWSNLPKKPIPTDNDRVDNAPGWVFDVCIQGVHLYGFDHVAIEPLPNNALKAFGWNTDVADSEASAPYKWGEAWEFYPPAPDPLIGNQMNTRQRKTVYTETFDPVFFGQHTSLGPVDVRPWSEWVDPPAAVTRHGIWVKDPALFNRHFEVRKQRNWREWL